MTQAAQDFPQLGPDWARFDAQWYQRHYNIAPGGAADLERTYQEFSREKRHSPNPYFHEAWYAATFADVAAQIANGALASGFEHYKTQGYTRRSPHWLFSESFYRMCNREITQAYLEDGGFRNGYDHYLRLGDKEKRQASLFFDPRLYLTNFVRADEALHISPFVHFAQHGFQNPARRRLSWYFDDAWYSETYPEIQNQSEYSSPLEHFIRNPTPGKFNPSRYFSEAFYAESYPDIASAVAAGKFRSGYDHFTQHGIFEKRQPHPEIDLDAYFRQVSVQADIENGRFRDAYAHYVAQHATPRPHQATPITANTAALARRPLDFTLIATPEISVVTVLQDDITLNLQSLEALQKAAPPGKTELILVDAGTGGDTRAISTFVKGATTLRFDWPIDPLQAANTGIRHAQAPVVLLLGHGVTVEGDSISAAQERLFSATNIGAVSGKLLRSHGLLQEAGGIIWRDGSVSHYQRDSQATCPEANFTRAVDFCSPDFLLLRRDVLQQTGSFSAIDAPLSHAELCIRIAKAGYRILYDPAVIATTHAEPHNLSLVSEQSFAFLQQNHAEFLARQPLRWVTSETRARHAQSDQRPRILFIEDRIPFRLLGSGYTRSNDIIHAMVRLGYHVTVFPVFRAVENLLRIYSEFSDAVEIVHDRELPDLVAFLNERPDYFDILWLGRTQNAARVIAILDTAKTKLPGSRKILDTEAVTAPRIRMRNRLHGLPEPSTSLMTDVAAELQFAPQFDTLIAVNATDAAVLREAGFEAVKILGHAQAIKADPTPFEERHGLLFVGALHDKESPNLDSLLWFVAHVLPKLSERLGRKITLTVAGYVNQLVDLSGLSRSPNVYLLGPQTDLAPLYARHRVFIASTRFAAGIPYKLHEAAAHGIPIVASELLAQQLGWETGTELLTADPADPEAFATQICALYADPALWERLRTHAITRLRQENSPQTYDETLAAILAAPSRVLGAP